MLHNTDHPLYQTWKHMHQRCTNPNNDRYERYGGRGIRVCERWSNFKAFAADMGERPIGTTLDRINNDGNYEPGNCRWATRKQQQRNTRQNVRVTIGGETRSLPEWCEILGFQLGTCRSRLQRGWPVERVLASVVPAPLRHKGHREFLKLIDAR